jgi:carbonic anhydrase
LLKNTYVQEALNNTGFPIIHGLVYDIADGILNEIPINLRDHQKKLRGIYNLNKHDL